MDPLFARLPTAAAWSGDHAPIVERPRWVTPPTLSSGPASGQSGMVLASLRGVDAKTQSFRAASRPEPRHSSSTCSLPPNAEELELESPLSQRDLDQFKLRLLEERKAVVARVLETMRQDTAFDTSDLPDELDSASAESTQGIILRLRDREGFYLRKIDEALRKIEAGVFGICEECDERIPLARLKVRPVALLCIQCKEIQEVMERSFAF